MLLLRSAVVTVALIGLAGPAPAQVFRLEAGSSSLYRADGGSIYVQAHGWDGWFGLAALDPVRLGGAIRTRVRNADLSLGDEIVPLRLPTDFFESGHLLFTRGLAVGVDRGGTKLRLRGGATSTVYSAPYFTAASSNDVIGMLEFETNVARSLTVSLRDLVSREQTHVLGLGWKPGAFHAGASGGTGGGEPYGAVGFSYEQRWLSMKAAYISAGDGFRRVRSERSQVSEIDRENFQVTWRPHRAVALTAGRNNYVQPASAGLPLARGAVDQFLAGGTFSGTSLRAAYFTSRSPGGGGTGTAFTIGRDLPLRSRSEFSVQRSNPRHGPHATSLLGTLRENLSTRFQTVQVLTHTEGHTTASFGGSFLSNPVTVGVEYQTIFLPFGERSGFEQAAMVTVRLQPWGNLQANVSSYVGPDGRVRYTAYGNDYLYRGENAAPQRISFTRNIVRGRVLDESGNPVPGAALRIGGTLVFTDSRGSFFLRFPKAGDYPLEVALEQFLTARRFEVVDAAPIVRAVDEAEAGEIVIRVRSIRLEQMTPSRPFAGRVRPVPAPVSSGRDSRDRLQRVYSVVHFALNSAQLSGPTCAMLDSLAASLRDTPDMRIRLAGHCDRRGGESYNQNLSRLRAQAVRDYLVHAGIGADRIEVAYYGKLVAPHDLTDTKELARARRVTFWYYTPSGVRLIVDSAERDLQIEAPER